MTYPGLILMADYSKYSIAAVLHQKTDLGEKFFVAKTRMLKPYEMNYYSAKRELLALLYGLEKFSHVLSCQQFLVMSDNF